MKREDAVRLVDELLRDLRDLDHQARVVDAKRQAHRQILDGVFRLFPDLRAVKESQAPPVSTSQPNVIKIADGQRRQETMRVRVKQALLSRRQWMSVRDIEAALRETGWETASANPTQMLRNVMSELAKSDRMVKRREMGDGSVQYRLAGLDTDHDDETNDDNARGVADSG
jgi:hypothetical protein